MAFSTLSDPYVIAAFWAGIGALLLTVLLSLQIVRLRLQLRRQQRHENRVHDKWRPVFNAAIVGETPEMGGTLSRKELRPFLKLWLHLQFSVRGDAQEALNNVARKLRVDERARKMLTGGNRAEKLSAALVLGYLRDTPAWPELLRLAGHKDNLLSLNAVWALLRIDPPTALQQLLPVIVDRGDWPLPRVVSMLQEVGEPALNQLTALVPQLPPERLPQALRLAEALRLSLPGALLSQLLGSDSPALLIPALRCVNTPEPLCQVRSLLRHPDWRVRVQVAKALGRIGDRDDISALVDLLRDTEWWVRYRAAQSLTALPGCSTEDMRNLRSMLADRFAVDMLAQVMAERGLS